MNLGTGLTLLGGLVGDTPTGAGRINTYGPTWFQWGVNRVLAAILRMGRDHAPFLWRTYAIDTAVAGVGVDYPLPADFGVFEGLRGLPSGTLTVAAYRFMLPSEFFAIEPTTTDPVVTIHSPSPMLRVAPVPTSGTTLTVWYRAKQKALTKTTDTFILPEVWDPAILACARFHASEVYMPKESEFYDRQADKAIQRVISELNANVKGGEDRIPLTDAMRYENI